MGLRTTVCSLFAAVLLAGCAIKTDEEKNRQTERPDPRNALRERSEAQLGQLGRAYLEALKNAPPQKAEDLRAYLKNLDEVLTSPRDNQPYEILWGQDPSGLPQDGLSRLLAWEKTADDFGWRCALLADCKSVIFMNEQLFKRLEERINR